MFDGKMLRVATGTPMRRTERAKSSLADAEPEPLTLANLTTKSLVAVICFMFNLPLVGRSKNAKHFSGGGWCGRMERTPTRRAPPEQVRGARVDLPTRGRLRKSRCH